MIFSSLFCFCFFFLRFIYLYFLEKTQKKKIIGEICFVLVILAQRETILRAKKTFWDVTSLQYIKVTIWILKKKKKSSGRCYSFWEESSDIIII